MNITSAKPGAFANGFEYFCADCGAFFSAQFEPDKLRDAGVEYCPGCGGDGLETGTDGLLNYCEMNIVDPVHFRSAFPPDEPIPQSPTGATPRQAEAIIASVINRKKEKLPVTVDFIAVETGAPRKTVIKIFDELHVTETGAAA